MHTDEKGAHELDYWQKRKEVEGQLGNTHYEYFYTQHFGLSADFYENKVILDLGCGPRGSLEWASMSKRRIGLDPLAESYKKLGADQHSMEYVASGVEKIPFADNFFDAIFSFNSLDHVDDLNKAISEIKRVLKPGGLFLFLSDVNHKPTKCEPITYSWDIVEKFTDLFKVLEVKEYEKSDNGIYASIQANISYDHTNKNNRSGIISAHFRKFETPIVSSLPKITVIIPVFNSESTLKLCLDSVTTVDYPKELLEIFVVDNGSTDKSTEIARNYDITLLFETETQSSYAARNKGIEEAKGELIAFTDADCIVTKEWLINIVQFWNDSTYGCFAGEIEAHKPKSLVEKFSHHIGLLRQKGAISGYHYLPYAQTANAAYRKEVLIQLGGFNADFVSGGDGDIAWRMQEKLGLKIKFIPEALVYHKHRTSFRGLYRQFRRYENGKFSFKKYYPNYKLPTLKQRYIELKKALWDAAKQFFPNIILLIRKKKTFDEIAVPLIKIIIHLAPLIVQWKRRKEKEPF